MKNTDIIITNCALIKQKKAKFTCLFMWFLLSLFAIRCRLRSLFKNSCFVFYRGFQTLENNKSPRPNGLGVSSVFSCLETSVKHSHSFLKYHFSHAFEMENWFCRIPCFFAAAIILESLVGVLSLSWNLLNQMHKISWEQWAGIGCRLFAYFWAVTARFYRVKFELLVSKCYMQDICDIWV